MNTNVRAALAHGHVVDITTTGRKTGQQRRIEIVFHNIDGRLIITGMPVADRKRGWLSNLETDPRLTLHLKGTVQSDLAARARVITDDSDRRSIAAWVAAHAWHGQDVDAMTAFSPMIEVTIDDLAA
jgi:deazaflavin-dependent oxidoreductase (nitroreductase family)